MSPSTFLDESVLKILRLTAERAEDPRAAFLEGLIHLVHVEVLFTSAGRALVRKFSFHLHG